MVVLAENLNTVVSAIIDKALVVFFEEIVIVGAEITWSDPDISWSDIELVFS